MATLAARHGVTEAEVLRCRDAFIAGMKAATATQVERRPRHRLVMAALVVLATTAFADLVVFQADFPAKASEVNANFALLKTWIEAKVGPVTSNAITATGLTVNGDVGINNTNPVNISNALTVGGAATLNGTATVQGRVTAGDLVANVETAYELSCSHAAINTSVSMNPYCCRMSVRDGSTTCAVSTNAGGTAWPTSSVAYPGLSATTVGRYHLSCVAGMPGANFPFCCRINANTGATVCGQGNSYSPGTAGTASISW